METCSFAADQAGAADVLKSYLYMLWTLLAHCCAGNERDRGRSSQIFMETQGCCAAIRRSVLRAVRGFGAFCVSFSP